MKKTEKSRALSGSYDRNILTFGLSEITIKNNEMPKVTINTAVFGERYFGFKKEELLGSREQTNTVELEAM